LISAQEIDIRSPNRIENWLIAIKKLLEIDPGMKAIVSSGYSTDPVLSRYKKHGFSDVVSKPYKIEEFKDVIQI